MAKLPKVMCPKCWGMARITPSGRLQRHRPAGAEPGVYCVVQGCLYEDVAELEDMKNAQRYGVLDG